MPKLTGRATRFPEVFSRNKELLASILKSRVEERGPDDCWLYRGPTPGFGYGSVSFKDEETGERWRCDAHRLVHALRIGRWPGAKEFVLHGCDNPPCCNPAHLSEGTPQKNMDDRSARGRSPKGGKNAMAKLTEAQVLAIKAALASSKPPLLRDLASTYGVHLSAIGLIKIGINWKHVELPKEGATP